MKTVSINLYELKELTGKPREKALDWIREHNLDWSSQILEDARKYGVMIQSWDLYSRQIDIRVKDPVRTAISIFEDYVETAEIYQQAKSFMEERNNIETNPVDNHYEQSQRFEGNVRGFIYLLGKMFLKNLTDEYNYQQSEEYCLETAEANDWMFDAQGNSFGNNP